MSPRSPWMCAALASAAVFGCGNRVTYVGDGGGGGQSSSGTGGGTTSSSSSSSSSSGTGGAGGIVPPECQVQTSEPPPYETTFVFTNNGPSPLFLAENCYLDYEVRACADGYAAPVAMRGDCTVDCKSEPNECIACGACPDLAELVNSGSAAEDGWKGYSYTFGTNAVGCQCHNQSSAAAGLYRIRVPVYPTEQAVYEGEPIRVVEQDFALPSPGGVVTVWLAPEYDE